MNDKELDRKVKALMELKEKSKQLENLIEDLKDEIKFEMTRRRVDTLDGIDWRIIWREHTLTRLDAEKLEEDFGDLSAYKKFTKYKSFYLKNK